MVYNENLRTEVQMALCCIFRLEIPSCLETKVVSRGSMRVMCCFKTVMNKNPKCHQYHT